MSLFERLNRVVRAEANYAKSQSVSPGKKVQCTIELLQDAVVKTRLAIAKTPPVQAEHLKLTLIDLEAKLSSARAQQELIYKRNTEVHLQKIDQLVGNDLSEIVGLFEEINDDIGAMKAQLSGFRVQQELIYKRNMEAQLQKIDQLVGNDLSEIVGLFEEINDDIGAMKAQLTSGSAFMMLGGL